VFIVDLPAIPVSDSCRDNFDPTFFCARFDTQDAEPANPGLVPPDGLLGQYPRPTLCRFSPFLEGPGHVRVREVQRSWNQPCDETRARST